MAQVNNLIVEGDSTFTGDMLVTTEDGTTYNVGKEISEI